MNMMTPIDAFEWHRINLDIDNEIVELRMDEIDSVSGAFVPPVAVAVYWAVLGFSCGWAAAKAIHG